MEASPRSKSRTPTTSSRRSTTGATLSGRTARMRPSNTKRKGEGSSRIRAASIVMSCVGPHPTLTIGPNT